MPTKLPPFEDINIDIFLLGSGRAYQNAADYSDVARFCFDKESYGHSLTLSVLGIEEIGKALGYLMLIREKLNPGSMTQDDPDDSFFSPEEILKVIHRKHSTKQLFSFTCSIISESGLFDIISQIKSQDITPSNVEETIHKIAKESDLTSESRLNKLLDGDTMEFMGELQSLKEAGMYVDIKTNPIRLTYPDEITEEQAEKSLDILDQYLGVMSVFGLELEE